METGDFASYNCRLVGATLRLVVVGLGRLCSLVYTHSLVFIGSISLKAGLESFLFAAGVVGCFNLVDVAVISVAFSVEVDFASGAIGNLDY